jgi:tRNA threonylcarbamoyladenosine biosynthesis protein TsaE
LKIKKGDKILLFGELGAGKTTFSQFLIKNILKDIDYVSSPTFSIMNEYGEDIKIYHADLYRIADPYEIEYIDLFNDEEGIYLIEWAEYLDYLTPKNRLEIKIKYNEDIKYRDIEINYIGNEYDEKFQEELI